MIKIIRQVMEDKIAELNRKYNADFRLLVTPVLPMASHELRNRLQQGGSVTGEIPIEAEEYTENIICIKECNDINES